MQICRKSVWNPTDKYSGEPGQPRALRDHNFRGPRTISHCGDHNRAARAGIIPPPKRVAFLQVLTIAGPFRPPGVQKEDPTLLGFLRLRSFAYGQTIPLAALPPGSFPDNNTQKNPRIQSPHPNRPEPIARTKFHQSMATKNFDRKARPARASQLRARHALPRHPKNPSCTGNFGGKSSDFFQRIFGIFLWAKFGVFWGGKIIGSMVANFQ